MNAADALSLLRAHETEDTNSVPSFFAKYRAASVALRPKRIFAICQFLYF